MSDRSMRLPQSPMIDAAQMRGALRALRELQLAADLPPVSLDRCAVGTDGPGTEPMKVRRIAAISGVRARLSFFLLLVCLIGMVPISSEGRLVPKTSRPVKAFRLLAGGSIQEFAVPFGPELVSMHFNTRHLFASLLTPSLLLLGHARAGDASFLPSDTITVQGVPNVPNDFTIECRVWIPSSSAAIIVPGAYLPAGCVFHAQRDSAMDTGLCVGPDGIYVKGPTYGYTSIPFTMPKNQWCHVAAVRRGSSIKAYLNGIEVGAIVCSAGVNPIVTNADVRIGAPVHNGSGQTDKGFTGRIDWLRISSVARYVVNFTVPSEESLAANDSATELLLRFNDAPGSTSVLDEGCRNFVTVVGDTRSMPNATSPRFSGGSISCPQDLDGDGAVGGGDIALLLLNWGPCPQ